jgi:hypothetical protein
VSIAVARFVMDVQINGEHSWSCTRKKKKTSNEYSVSDMILVQIGMRHGMVIASEQHRWC